ncbi:MAG TPA: UDP-N-acetylmuramate--L-alanine ligase [Thermomicrobiaceae bacterium]|nr:UDP-N-acetylmuramate--L-alanine ligase [Thermomicrobiaceae bacterium]
MVDASVELPPPPATVHLIGIGGIGMSGLARILAARGYVVTGSDAAESPVVQALRDEGFLVAIGHDPMNLGAPQLVVATAAARSENPELAAARSRGLPVVKRAVLLGRLCDERDCIAVAGTHGKSTTCGMLALALVRAGLDPSFAVGAVVSQLGTNARPGQGAIFVAEADEYDYSFLSLHPSVAIVTNVEHDHPDLFPTPEAVDDAFARFAAQLRPDGTLVVSADDPGCRRLVARLGATAPRVVTFGTAPDANWRLRRAPSEDGGPGDTLVRAPGGDEHPLDLRVPGWHNRLNAVAALAGGVAAGLSVEQLLPGITEFAGVGRRFEERGRVAGVTVIDDYAHHPTEIAVNIAAARERYPGARLWAVFQPHTYSRTRLLLDRFAEALSGADRVVLAAIYAARETDDLGVSSADVASRITGPPVDLVGSADEAGERVASAAQVGDVVLVLGAGDIWKASETLLRSLAARDTGQRPA